MPFGELSSLITGSSVGLPLVEYSIQMLLLFLRAIILLCHLCGVMLSQIYIPSRKKPQNSCQDIFHIILAACHEIELSFDPVEMVVYLPMKSVIMVYPYMQILKRFLPLAIYVVTMYPYMHILKRFLPLKICSL